MIVIDMDMSKNCRECAFFDGEDMCYADGTFALSQSAFKNRPKWCPIKCDIEDIKAEVKKAQEEVYDAPQDVYEPDYWMREGMDYVLKIIDKHMKGDMENEV